MKGVFYEKPTATVGVDFAIKQITKDELKNPGNTNTTSSCSDMQGFFKGSDHKDSLSG